MTYVILGIVFGIVIIAGWWNNKRDEKKKKEHEFIAVSVLKMFFEGSGPFKSDNPNPEYYSDDDWRFIKFCVHSYQLFVFYACLMANYKNEDMVLIKETIHRYLKAHDEQRCHIHQQYLKVFLDDEIFPIEDDAEKHFRIAKVTVVQLIQNELIPNPGDELKIQALVMGVTATLLEARNESVEWFSNYLQEIDVHMENVQS